MGAEVVFLRITLILLIGFCDYGLLKEGKALLDFYSSISILSIELVCFLLF